MGQCQSNLKSKKDETAEKRQARNRYVILPIEKSHESETGNVGKCRNEACFEKTLLLCGYANPSPRKNIAHLLRGL